MRGKYLVPMLAAGVMALSPASGLETIAGKGAAEAQSALPSPVDYSAYKTVDDILDGSGIRKVPVSDYQREIATGDVVVFFYDKKFPHDADGRLAKVLKQLRPEFMNTKFIALEYDKSVPVNTYVSMGFEVTPDFMVYRDGKVVFRNPSISRTGRKGGGPKEGYEHSWVESIRQDLRKTLQPANQ